MRPMLATRGTRVPTGPAWVHEVKWDGMRVLLHVKGGKVRIFSRNENDVTASFPELAGITEALHGHDAVLDGEVVALLDGIPTFGALAGRIHNQKPDLDHVRPVVFFAFDVLQVDGQDVTAQPLSVRRQLLDALDLQGPHWQTPAQHDDGEALQAFVTEKGLEGVVSKRRASAYRTGQRSEDWLKFANRPTGSYVVGGWRYETDSTTRLGAVLVGEPTADGLIYRGRVGSGLAGAKGVTMKELLDPLGVDASPFADEVPREDSVGTVWVRPTVVVEIASLGFTPQHRLRQPSYLGLRADLDPEDLVDG